MKRRPATRLGSLALALALALAALAGPAAAVNPDEQLADPRLEARARDIGGELRCVVCQNQTIDESDAPLARDLRLIVRERLAAGESDRQVVDFVVARYGTFVLLDPPFERETLVLWLGPALVLAAGGAMVGLYLRGRLRAARASPIPLSEEEKARLASLLGPADRS